MYLLYNWSVSIDWLGHSFQFLYASEDYQNEFVLISWNRHRPGILCTFLYNLYWPSMTPSSDIVKKNLAKTFHHFSTCMLNQIWTIWQYFLRETYGIYIPMFYRVYFGESSRRLEVRNRFPDKSTFWSFWWPNKSSIMPNHLIPSLAHTRKPLSGISRTTGYLSWVLQKSQLQRKTELRFVARYVWRSSQRE